MDDPHGARGHDRRSGSCGGDATANTASASAEGRQGASSISSRGGLGPSAPTDPTAAAGATGHATRHRFIAFLAVCTSASAPAGASAPSAPGDDAAGGEGEVGRLQEDTSTRTAAGREPTRAGAPATVHIDDARWSERQARAARELDRASSVPAVPTTAAAPDAVAEEVVSPACGASAAGATLSRMATARSVDRRVQKVTNGARGA